MDWELVLALLGFVAVWLAVFWDTSDGDLPWDRGFEQRDEEELDFVLVRAWLGGAALGGFDDGDDDE
jgi:hypothetical protein